MVPDRSAGFRVESSGFRVKGLRATTKQYELGCGVCDRVVADRRAGFRVEGSGFRVEGLRAITKLMRVWGW